MNSHQENEAACPAPRSTCDEWDFTKAHTPIPEPYIGSAIPLSNSSIASESNASESTPLEARIDVDVDNDNGNDNDNRNHDKNEKNNDNDPDPSPDSWRQELALRLERYRTRRKPRAPRYPSLFLPFDAPQTRSRSVSSNDPAQPAQASTDFVFFDSASARTEPSFKLRALENSSALRADQDPYQHPDPPGLFANVIEFPRSAVIPVFDRYELAEPVIHRPRIVEAPEILPPPPALGGMLMEPAEPQAMDRVTDVPTDSASLARRALAVLVDGTILSTALAAFAAIFLRLNPTQMPVPLQFPLPATLRSAITETLPWLAGTAIALTLLWWAAYKYALLVYTGSTPGLRVARLQLVTFSGAPLTRTQRRWRVLASFLSAAAAGLGYLWCLLDQEKLSWHDRITRTYLKSLPKELKPQL
jgi:uncharacterized RDD family membrane protein YckC